MATTKLQAVNEILKTVGISPVNSLTSGVYEAEQAEQALDTVSREVQSGQWDWNAEDDIELTPDTNGHIPVPAGAIRMDASDKTLQVVTRGGRLYDKKKHTAVFAEPLKVNVKWELAWDDLPEPARQYIYLLAATRFQLTYLGSDSLDRQLQPLVTRAFVALKNYDTEQGDYNILTGDPETMAIWFRTEHH